MKNQIFKCRRKRGDDDGLIKLYTVALVRLKSTYNGGKWYEEKKKNFKSGM